MKKLFLFLLVIAIAIVSGSVMADTLTAMKDTVFTNPHTLNANDIPLGGTWQEWFGWAIGILLLMWEILLRAIPTAKNWSIISKIVTILDWIVSLFNGVGNAAKTADGTKKAFKTTVK